MCAPRFQALLARACFVALQLLPAAASYNLSPTVTLPPAWQTELQDFKDMFVQYRARLSAIVRHAAAVLPEQALGAAQRRLDAAVAACSPGSGGQLADAVFVVWHWSWLCVCRGGLALAVQSSTLSIGRGNRSMGLYACAWLHSAGTAWRMPAAARHVQS